VKGEKRRKKWASSVNDNIWEHTPFKIFERRRWFPRMTTNLEEGGGNTGQKNKKQTSQENTERFFFSARSVCEGEAEKLNDPREERQGKTKLSGAHASGKKI